MNPGQVIADRFEIERVVGSGGMGTVYRARDRLTGGPVAIKLLNLQLARDKERFRREAQLLSEISHPRVVRYVAHGVTPADHPYLAMEWLDGEDLAERLTRTGLTMAESVLLTKRVAEALGAMHERGIVHRDIKPSNLFLPNWDIGQVKLLDLGIARFADSMHAATRSGVMIGTPGYMAPEQARGAKGVDARVDVFALGCVLFECLTGSPAFVGDNVAAVLAKILLENSPRVSEMRSEVPELLDELVARMLSKHPAVRPADGMAVARELGGMTTMVPEGPRPAASREVRALTGGERRLVSVVMATPQDLPPAAANAPTLSGATVLASNDRLYAVVAPFGAQLECLASGSLVVTVMGRRSATDQAAHAGRCALALRERIPDAPMALVTGLAVVTDRFLAGDVIDRAAKMLASAEEPGGLRLVAGAEDPLAKTGDRFTIGIPIRIDETTAGLLDSRFLIGGNDQGLTLRGLRPQAEPTRTLLGRSTPFVGREREIGALSAMLKESAEEPVARVVLVTAAAGAGKSRLMHEFVRRARQESDAQQVWTARGDPMSEGSPFSLLSQLVRSAAGIIEGEAVPVRQQKLRARLGRHLDGEALARVADFLGELIGAPFSDAERVQLKAARHDPMLMGDQMRRAWTEWLSVECAAQPVLLVLDDLQWGDLPTVRFVEAALRQLEDVPLMVLALARPEVHEHFPNLWSERELQEIRLAALTKRAAEKLARDVLGERGDDVLIGRLVERAAGNAFYLEELIRAVAEGRGEALPETVLAMVEARLERLDPEARRVLRAASIFGQTFWRTGMLALLGGERKTSEVDEWLEELASREVIMRTADNPLPHEQEWTFRHALVREAAYAMLTSDDRALGHKLAGEWLETTGLSEPVVLAEHFERGRAPARAIEWYRRAAVQALEGNDFQAAIDRVELAVGCGASGEMLGRLHLLSAEALNWCGEHREEAQLALLAMSELLRGGADWFTAGAELATASWRLGDRERLVTLAAEFRSVDDSHVSAERLVATARLISRLLLAGAFELAEGLLGWLERCGGPLAATNPEVAGWLNHARAIRATVLGDAELEIRLLEDTVAHFERAGDVRNACVNRQNLAYCLMQHGVLEQAEAHLRSALDTAERMGIYGVVLSAKQNLGQVLARRGDYPQGIAIEREAIAGFQATGDAIMEGASHAYLAMFLRTQGQLDEAMREVESALPLLKGIPPLYAPALGAMAAIELERGNAEGALEAATQAWTMFRELGGVTEGEALIRLCYAEALHAVGRHDEACAAIVVARERLLERATHITNPAWRRSFLEKIRENARTLARAGEWLR